MTHVSLTKRNSDPDLIISHIQQVCHQWPGELQRDANRLVQPVRRLYQQQICDGLQIAPAKLVEDNDVIHAVQQLRSEVCLQTRLKSKSTSLVIIAQPRTVILLQTAGKRGKCTFSSSCTSDFRRELSSSVSVSKLKPSWLFPFAIWLEPTLLVITISACLKETVRPMESVNLQAMTL